MESKNLDGRGGLPGVSCKFAGDISQGIGNKGRRKEQEPQEDRGGSRAKQSAHLELELHPRMGKGVRFGSVAKLLGAPGRGRYHR